MCFSVLNVGAFACQGALGKQSEMVYTTETHYLAILETGFQGQGVGWINSSQGWEEESTTCDSFLGFTIIFIVLGLETHCPIPASVFTRHSPCQTAVPRFPPFYEVISLAGLVLHPLQWGLILTLHSEILTGTSVLGPQRAQYLLTLLKTVHAFNDAMTELLTYISLWLVLSFCFVSCFVLKQSLLEPRLAPNSLPSPRRA